MTTYRATQPCGIHYTHCKCGASAPPDIVEAYNAGASLRELAELHGVSTPTIRRRLLDAGATLRSPGGRHAHEDLAPRARTLRDAGLSVADIAALLGRSRQRVYQLLGEES